MNMTETRHKPSIGDIIDVVANMYNTGNIEAAWNVCSKGLQAMPNSPELLHFSGVLAYQTGLRKAGWDMIQKAIRIGQTIPMDNSVIWAAYSTMNLIALAGRLQDVSVRVHECALAGDVFWHRRQLEAAETVCRRALTLVPNIPEIIQKLSKILWERGSCEEARTHYMQFLQINDQDTANRDIEILPVRSVKTYCSQKGCRYVTVFPPEPCRIHRHEVFGRETRRLETTAVLPEIYLSEIPDVDVFGGNVPMVTGDGFLLYDLACHAQSDRYELSTPGVVFCDQHNGLIDVPRPVTLHIDEAVMFSGGSSTWAHWLVETLPRFSILEKFPEYDRLPILLDEGSLSDPHNRETFMRLNKTGREVIFLKKNQRYHCQRLICPSKMVSIPHDMKPWTDVREDDELVSPRSVTYIRKQFGRPVGSMDGGHRLRIYIPRTAAAYRKLLNEAQIRSIFKRYDFIEVYPNRISLEEKLDLFSNAEIIAGPGSSGLANQKFAPPGTVIFTLIPETWVSNSLPPSISAYLGQRHLTVAGAIRPGTHGQPYHCDYTVDPQQVEAALKMLTAATTVQRN